MACSSRDEADEGNPTPTPQDRLEALVAERFGLEVVESDDWIEADAEAAHLILAVSPHADVLDGAWNHPCYYAQASVGWDLIVMARSRGWYTPTRAEYEDPAFGCCDGCGHFVSAHEEDGCHAGCGCTVAHTPHVNPERERQARG